MINFRKIFLLSMLLGSGFRLTAGTPEADARLHLQEINRFLYGVSKSAGGFDKKNITKFLSTRHLVLRQTKVVFFRPTLKKKKEIYWSDVKAMSANEFKKLDQREKFAGMIIELNRLVLESIRNLRNEEYEKIDTTVQNILYLIDHSKSAQIIRSVKAEANRKRLAAELKKVRDWYARLLGFARVQRVSPVRRRVIEMEFEEEPEPEALRPGEIRRIEMPRRPPIGERPIIGGRAPTIVWGEGAEYRKEVEDVKREMGDVRRKFKELEKEMGDVDRELQDLDQPPSGRRIIKMD